MHSLKAILKMAASRIILKPESDDLTSLVNPVPTSLTPLNIFSTSHIETKSLKEADRFSVCNIQRITVLC